MIVRTLIADRSELSLIGMRSILSEAHRVELVGVARDAVAMQAMIVRHKPHVVLLDHTAEGFGAQSIKDGLKRSRTTA
ncbi:MAG TPA: hypothetical protein PL070_04090 [Flavobacteriales bacterium]|nr:hypothetical protein [Flavobacteriales bacterium]